MKKTIKIALIFASIAVCLIFFFSFSTEAFVKNDVTQQLEVKSFADLQHVMKTMQAKTAVSMGIPKKFPKYVDFEKYGSYIRNSVNSNYYEVNFIKDPECEDLYRCIDIAFVGSTSPVGSYNQEYKGNKKHQPKPVPTTNVILKNGDKALFYEPDCGAYCPLSELVWQHGRFYYMISFMGSLEDATDIANTIDYNVNNPKKPRK